MRLSRNWVIAITVGAAVLAAAVVSPALGGPSLRTLVKREVARQLANAQGPAGQPGQQGQQGIQGPPGAPATPIGGTIPSGTTLRGTFFPRMAQATPNVTNAVAHAVSFGGFQLSARPLVEVIGEGDPSTTNCPGTVDSPSAISGYVCLYMAEEPGDAGAVVAISDPSSTSAPGINWNPSTGVATTFGDGKVSRFGFGVSVSDSVGNGTIMWGTWAVTG